MESSEGTEKGKANISTTAKKTSVHVKHQKASKLLSDDEEERSPPRKNQGESVSGDKSGKAAGGGKVINKVKKIKKKQVLAAPGLVAAGGVGLVKRKRGRPAKNESASYMQRQQNYYMMT